MKKKMVLRNREKERVIFLHITRADSERKDSQIKLGKGVRERERKKDNRQIDKEREGKR